jgi:RAD50-interacting protein 1
MASYGLQRQIPSISRERSPVVVLTDRSSIDIGERDIRVDDYLNDKLQTASDFANLDSLIASVETQRIQLQGQVGGLISDFQSEYCGRRRTVIRKVSSAGGLTSTL